VIRRTILAVALLAGGATACDAVEYTDCEFHVDRAGQVAVGEDPTPILDEALAACTLEEFAAETADRDVLDGVDPALFVSNRCEFNDPTLAICSEVGR